MSKEREVEILAPAGSWASLTAALKAGAGAVYFGVGKLNMRARAAMNFGEADLPEITAACREAGVRGYLTLNNILYDEELEAARQLCEKAAGAGVDAIICHDPAVIRFVREAGLPVHLSTQANVSNTEAVRTHARFADVIVLARELTLEQISRISRRIREEDIRGPSGRAVRLEAFVHGALCVAISGKCQMSLYQYNHSANRGDCFQSCRRSYRVTDTQTGKALEIDNEYVMSPRDLCTIGCLDELLDAGISVLKIEGRGRSADYVSTVVRCYREAVEAIRNGAFTEDAVRAWQAELETVFNRGFWDGGYYLGKRGDDWSGFSGNRATRVKKQIGIVSNFYQAPSVVEIQLQNGSVETGDALQIIGPTSGCIELHLDAFFKDEAPARKAGKGDVITCRIPERARRNDKVFRVTDAPPGTAGG